MNKKHYLVVGGTAGIGLAIANQLASLGHELTVISRGNHPTIKNQPNIDFINADVTDVELNLPQVTKGIDGLVYCPGSINLKPFRTIKPDDFRNEMNINFISAARVIQNYLPQILTTGNGSIVMFSTVAVQTGMAFHTSIAAAKGAVEGFARSLAAELAPKVRVNVIAPSLTNTQLSGRLINSEQKLEAANSRHPLGRIGDPDDIAEMACYLLSDKSKWVTAQVFKVDGGMSSIK